MSGKTSRREFLKTGAPFGRIHWAGIDTATIWMGTINGAAQSGERAAAEVLSAPR